MYSEILDYALSKVLSESMPICEPNEAFTRAVIYAARRGIPRGMIRKYSTIWTTEFAQAVAKRKQARREYFKSKTTTNRKRTANGTTLSAERKIGQFVRTKEWRRVCENLNPSSDPKIACQFIRRVSGRDNTARVEPLIVKWKEMSTDRKEADALNKYL
ncbi:hypothetical protein PoB_005033900 [Plakobranchus ocellatus]|uniref:Uncharacterized protein n=1 Tax=Plakobranchus ocellatus TaxID=259542 RepID=A0AAV4BZK1_9GAST|nr:hypothetical protein PoB_005033900 [Plakobranchus ocellatus]